MTPASSSFMSLLGTFTRTRILLVAIAACAVLLAMAASPSVRADGFTYTYTGLPFDSFSPGSTCPPHCGIAATLNLPVLASQGTVEYNSIVVTDGLAILFDISISSDIGSSETSWNPNFGMFSFSFTSDPFPSIACSKGQMEEVIVGFTNEADDFSEGECVDSSGNVKRILWQDSVETGGTWSGPGIPTSTVPEPSAMLLLPLGLIGLTFFGNRRHGAPA
jgi:PEP-CTERM motif